jgi:hypothetical protein
MGIERVNTQMNGRYRWLRLRAITWLPQNPEWAADKS